MGACCTTNKLGGIEKLIRKKLTDSIRDNSVEKVRTIISSFCTKLSKNKPVFNIDQPITKIYGKDINALGYSLFLGNAKIFALILEFGKAKLSVMDSFYSDFNRTPLDVICELGHKKLLEYYFPLYLKTYSEQEEIEAESLSLSISVLKPQKKSELEAKKNQKETQFSCIAINPLHRACEKNKKKIINYFYEYSKIKVIPEEFNINYIDENTGDNCALVSCRTGDLELISYLYEKLGADFHVINKRKESAIQVLAVWSKKKRSGFFLECFKYLIDVVGVDFTYEYEETILVLEDEKIIKYFENKLKHCDIYTNKENIDKKYAPIRNSVPPLMNLALEKRLNNVKGTNFNFKSLFKKELEDSNNDISRISENDWQSLSKITIIL